MQRFSVIFWDFHEVQDNIECGAKAYRITVSERAGRWRMKRWALCVLVFPVDCFVDRKGGYFWS